MRVNEKMRKALSILLCLCMLLQNAPVMAFAATTDNLCEHHTEHTAECGYREGSAGSACTHEHSEDCYAILECLHTCGEECADGCTHECTVENGCITMELDCHHVHGGCGYSEGTAEVPCGHVHNENCGYVEAVAGNPCANAETAPECDHSGDCGFVAAVEGQPCGHTDCDDTCGYAPATEGTPCTHVCEVKVNSADSCYKLLCSHKDGGHDDACGYAEAVEAHECHYECAECAAVAASEEPSEESSEPAPVCDCGTDDGMIHATTCAMYVAPENPMCYCSEKCTEVNEWCDVCGFDYTACTGTDTAVQYDGGAIDLSTLTGTYVISDSGEYTFTGSGNYGIKVESGNPGIVLNNASITVGEGSAIDVASGSNATIFVLGDNTIGTTKTGYSDVSCGGIFVAEGGTVNITSNGTDNILRAHGTLAAAIGGKYDYDNNESYNAGSINISNVTVYAYTNNFYAAAIGAAGEGTCGTINITNAVVYAYGAGDKWTSAPGIGNAWSLLDWSDTIPIVIISDSEVHTFRYNPYSDYIGYLGDESGDTYATGSINCGDGGSVKNSTIYCYTGLDATTTDKVVKYGALGGLLKEDGTCEGEHSGGTATCTTLAVCENCGASYGERGNHSTAAEGDRAATCKELAYCSVCQKNYGEVDSTNHASTEFTYTANEDGTTHKKAHKCCDATAAETEAHTLDVTTGKCSACGADMTAIATVTDGTNTYYAADAATLNQAVTAILETGSRTFTVELPADAEAGMITAIRRAICDTDGVADGSIHLTLKGVTSIPGTTNWDGVAFGPRNAQWDENNVEIVSHEEVTQLASVNLPDVTEIGAQAFLDCSNLTSITAPKVQFIGDWGLQGTAITSIDMPLLKEAGYSAFCSTALTEVSLPALETAGVIVFGHCKQLRTVDLPKLQNLSQQLFTRCTSLVSVSAPAATSMGNNVFKGCSELVSITLPGVTELTYEAFTECTKLENITLGSVITKVNANLFDGEALSSGITLTLNCGQEKAETLPAAVGTNVAWAGFTWKEVKFAHSYVNSKCTACGEDCAHTGGTATCTTPAVCEACGVSYGEVDTTNHDSSVECVNGFCPNGCYEPATLNAAGYYEIDNAGKLFWFAQQVNVKGNREIKGVLTAHIDLENRPWTPIGSTGENNNNFRGVFDGQGRTIRGLNVEGSENGVGFFGEVRTGTVKNFTIYGNVVVNTEVDYVGGVIGSICGLNSTDHGLERNGATIQNITSFVNVTAKAHGIGMIGGFVGYANHQSLIEQCAWYGTFDAGEYRVDSGAGGFIGKIQENTSEVTIRNCGAYGTIKTNYAGDYNNTATIYMGGFLSFSNTNAKTTLENCLFAGKFERGENLTDQAFLGAFGTLRSVNAIKNCYYLGDDGLAAVHSDSNLKPGSDNVEITSVTGEELRNNTIATQLGEYWTQGIHYPILKEGQTWHGDSATYTYTDNGDGTHKKTCNECGYVEEVKEEHYVDPTTTYTDNGDGTHSFKCAKCDAVMDSEPHTIENHACTACGAMEIVVSFDAGDYKWETGNQIRLARWTGDFFDDYYFTAEVAEDGTVTWTPDKTLCWNGTDKHTLAVSYPNMHLIYDNFGIPEDQSTLEKLREADCMNAIWSGNPTTDPITFDLKHRLAKVTVNYEIAEGVTVSKAEVYTLTQYVFFDVDTLERRNIAWEEGHDLWINSYHNGNQFTAFVSPDAYAADGNFIKITLSDGSVREVKMNKAVTFEEGAEYTYKVLITADGAYLTCADECTFEYTDNEDGLTHSKTCSKCGYVAASENHTLTYTKNGSTITESCSANCGYSASLTLKAPANLVFDRTEKEATVEGEIIADYELTYSADAVIMAGDYTATLTVGDYSVSLAFTIAKADPDVVTPSDLKATYGQTLADVKLPGGWAWKNSSASVGSVGSNTFAAIYTPANISNFNTLERDLTVVVAKAMPTVTAPVAADDLGYNGTAQTLITAGTATGGTMQYSLDGSIWSETIPTGKDAKTYTVYYKVVGDSNHNDSSVDSVQVTIGKAALTITADSYESVRYGSAAPAFAANYSGFVNGETEAVLGGELVFSCEYDTADVAKRKPGNYPIVPGGLTSNNYEISYVDGNLEVISANLVIVIDDKTVTYGDAAPEYTYHYEGFVYGEDISVMDEPGTVSCAYVPGNAVGTMEIKSDNYGSDDCYYVVNQRIGTLTVEKAPLIVTAKDNTITYGDEPSASGVEYSGFVNNETESVLTGTVAYSYSYEQFGNVGTYKITPGGLTSNNYEITFADGTLTVNAKAITVTAKDQSITYGDTISGTEITATGLVDGHSVTVNLTPSTANVTVSGTITASAAVISADNADVTGNYNVSYTTGNLVIKPDTSKIDALTTDNVTSANEEDIKAVQAMMASAETDGVDEATAAQWAAITATCEDLIDKIEAVETENARIADAVSEFDLATVKSSDETAISQLISDIDDQLATNNLTDEERSELEGLKTKCNKLIAKIDGTETLIGQLDKTVDDLDAETVKSTDKENLEQLAKDIEDLLDTDNLTEDEREALETVLKQVEGMIDTIEDTAEDSKAATEAIDALDPATVTSDDKDELEQAIETIDELLEDDHLTEDERKALEDAKADAEALIDVIEAAQEATDTENTEKVEDVMADNVKPEDKESLEDAKADLEKALEDNAGNYTEEEKRAIRDEIQRIDDAIEALENVEDVTDAITQLPETVEPDDEEAAEKILDAKEAYDELTDHEKSLVDEDTKKKLDDLVASLTAYDIIKGDGGKWTKGSDGSLTFTANGPFSKFVGIEVDGKEVDEKYYDAKAGSTIITLKQSFLKRLSTGEHTITVLYTDGETSGTFKILAASSTPATGDDSNIMLWSGVLGVSTLGLVVLLADRKRRRSAK